MTAIANVPSGGAAVFWGVITFSLLIVLHEGGHFLAARAFGLKVHEFMLGLPAPGLKWRSKRSGVRYGVTLLPLGGYVRIAGMEPGREDELLGDALGLLVARARLDAGDLASLLGVSQDRAHALFATLEDYGAAEAVPDSADWVPLVSHAAGEDDAALLARVRTRVFRGLPMWKRVTVLAMGVVVNIVSAMVILTLALTIVGVPTTATTSIHAVQVPSPAATAGLRPGDRITSLDGTPVTSWAQLRSLLAKAHPPVPLTVGVGRGAGSLYLTVRPSRASGGGAYLGVTAAMLYVPMSVPRAVGETFATVGAVFVAVARFFDPRTFASAVHGASSVVGVSYLVAGAAEEGPLEYAWMVTLISLSLGIMNMLPIPPLDGGKIALEVWERIMRRHVPRKVSIAFSTAGTLLLFSLVFYLMYADVVRYVIRG
jgi:regulator of sigma E protease